MNQKNHSRQGASQKRYKALQIPFLFKFSFLLIIDGLFIFLLLS